MRTLCTAFALLSVGLLAGCTEAPAPKAVEAAPQQAQVRHNFRLYGTPEKGEFMIDSDAGTVWQYQETTGHVKQFVQVPVVSDPEEPKVEKKGDVIDWNQYPIAK